jgi:hypothetical protein
MSGYTFVHGFTNDFDSWSQVIQKTLAVPSYKRFIEVTASIIFKLSLTIQIYCQPVTEISVTKTADLPKSTELEKVFLAGTYLMSLFFPKFQPEI